MRTSQEFQLISIDIIFSHRISKEHRNKNQTTSAKKDQRSHLQNSCTEVTNPDPDYHFKAVTDALKIAKEKLPKAETWRWSRT